MSKQMIAHVYLFNYYFFFEGGGGVAISLPGPGCSKPGYRHLPDKSLATG